MIIYRFSLSGGTRSKMAVPWGIAVPGGTTYPNPHPVETAARPTARTPVHEADYLHVDAARHAAAGSEPMHDRCASYRRKSSDVLEEISCSAPTHRCSVH